MLYKYNPIAIRGDGNCFYRAVSKGLFGTKDYHLHIRLLTSIEIGLNPNYYSSSDESYIDILKDPLIVHCEYNQLLWETSTPREWAKMLNVVATSSALNVVITTFCPSTINRSLLSDPLTKVVHGRNVSSRSSKSSLTLMWSMLKVPKNPSNYAPDHFVLLENKEILSSSPPLINVSDSTDEEIVIPENASTPTHSENSASLSPSPPLINIRDSTDEEIVIPEDRSTPTHSTNSAVLSPSPHLNNIRDSTEEEIVIPEDRSTPTHSENSGIDNSFDEEEILPPQKKRKLIVNDTADQTNDVTLLLDNNNSWLNDSLPVIEKISKSHKCQASENAATNSFTSNNLELSTDYDETKSSRNMISDSVNLDEQQSRTHEDHFPIAGGHPLPLGPHLKARFLNIDELKEVLHQNNDILDEIPRGTKQNVYFIVNIKTNLLRRSVHKHSEFWDDCGVRNLNGPTNKSYYLKTSGKGLQKVYLKQGKYCKQQQQNYILRSIPFDPQPETQDIVTLFRYYLKHSSDEYEKRVSWIEPNGPETACFEYRGKYPFETRRGNSKQVTNPYIRLNPTMMQKVKESSKKVSEIYNEEDLINGPRNIQQVIIDLLFFFYQAFFVMQNISTLCCMIALQPNYDNLIAYYRKPYIVVIFS